MLTIDRKPRSFNRKMKTGALQTLLSRPPKDQESAGYSHTAAEIASQPAVWRKTREVVRTALPALADFCAGTDRLILTGAGSSYFAAVSMMPLIGRAFDSVEAIPSTEILMDPESCFPRGRFILVSLARSGNSPEGNAVFALANQLRPGMVRHLVITCDPDGELSRLAVHHGPSAFRLLLPEESNDKGLAMTASFTSLTIAGFALGFLRSPSEYAAVVDGLCKAAEVLLAGGSSLASAESRNGYTRMFFLASRPFFGGALEAHLKVQELSGGAVVAKAEDTLGFRHGPMAAADANSLIVLFLSRDPYRRRYEIDLLNEMRDKRMGKKTIVVCDSRDDVGPVPADSAPAEVIVYGPAPAVTDEVRAPLLAVTGQLLGLFFSLGAGLHPDNPSPSGIISRVVQGVRIHPYDART
jgi:tagatose-6-phosphate ketose/aldose isomerase